MSDKSEKASEPSFEKALGELEELVSAMEDGDIPLAELVERYAQGTRLLKHCQARLKDAEMKIELLKNDGSDSVQPFEPET